MDERGPLAERAGGDGCLTVAVRMPVRVFALIVILPLRIAWDAVTAVGRGIGAALTWLWRRAAVEPLSALWRRVLAPAARATAAAASLLVRVLLVVPVVALYRYLLAPLGRGAV